MSSWSNYRIRAISIAYYFLLWIGLHFSLGYLLDSDAVAYLTISHRVANGDWLRSVNGLWSPLNSWLIVPFIKNGMDSWQVAKGLNLIFGFILLLQSFNLFKALKFDFQYANLFSFILPLVICFYTYFQVFADVLQLIFALAYVRLIIHEDFILNRKFVLLSAIVMGLGFYAKAYSLVFFILHISVVAFLAVIKNRKRLSSIVLNYFLGLLVAVLIALPWAFQLEKKYNEFSLTGFAGKLNMSWYINSGKTFKDEIKLLIPPTYDDSPSFWEDPYQSQGVLSTPLSSSHHFKRWVLRVGHTCLMALKCVSEITVFFIPIVLLYLIKLYRRKKLSVLQQKIFSMLVILPLGYLAMHIETRYIWLETFLIMILGLWQIQSMDWSKLKKKVAVYIFAFSFWITPVYSMFNLNNKNKNLFELADQFKAQGIQGKIVSNINDEGSLWVVSYLAGLNDYTIEKEDYSLDLLIEEMRRYNIKNYLHYHNEGGRYNISDNDFKKSFKKGPAVNSENPVLYILKD